MIFLKKQFVPLEHQLTNLFSKYNISKALRTEIQTKIEDQFRYLFSNSTPSDLQQQRALYEKNLIQTIRSSLKKNNLILRRLSMAYELLSSNEGQKHKVKVPSIYFLPDVSEEDVLSLVSFITSKYSTTWNIGQLINKILRPFVDKTLKSTTYRDEMDFIQKLNHYVSTKRRLQSTTLFCSIKITNFYTLDTHQNVIDTVGYFLEDHLGHGKKLQQLTIMTIKNLLHLFFFNNIFCYKEQIYTFTKGSPNTMPLTETLSNIYLYVWQKKILNRVKENNELFGRYKDEIFFTWNKSNALTLETFLQKEIREKYINVRFQYSIGTNVEFLNAYVENRDGQLYTRVFHQPTTIHRYTLPYVIGHSKVSHSDWLRYALIRAVCYCSSVEDFRQERIYLELTYLSNGYSLLFVESHIRHFFEYFHMANMRYSNSQTDYDNFRQYWFNFMTMQHELTDELKKFEDNAQLIHLKYFYEFGPRCQFDQQFSELCSSLISNNNIDLTLQSSPDQLLELSNEITVKVETTSDAEHYTEQEQRQHENVIVNLSDCMECYVQIPQSEIVKQNDGFNPNIQADIARQIHEFREEQETTPQNTQASQHSNQDHYNDFEALCHEK
ncbi:unnamed protein product [Rotaria sp. Silwood1]|nr:unnamed protein product [Rotaria sp. Silwood1]